VTLSHQGHCRALYHRTFAIYIAASKDYLARRLIIFRCLLSTLSAMLFEIFVQIG